MILMLVLSSPRSTNCLAKLPACTDGMNTNTACGEASRTRCKNGAKSGFCNGTRMESTIRPPDAKNRALKEASASWPGAKSLISVTTSLMPVLTAQSAIITDDCASVQLVRTKYWDLSITADVLQHDDGRHLRFGDDR